MEHRYGIVSGDSHLDIAPERWTARVPARWRDRVPRLVKLPGGTDGIIVENRPALAPALAITGKPYEQHVPDAVVYEGSPGTGTPEQRLREQDQDGVDAEILFTHPMYPNHWRGIRDNEPYRAMFRAYNEFLAEEYCAAAPDRLIAMGLIPDTGVDDAVEEMEYCVRAGFKGVALIAFPSGKSGPAPEDDRFWAAALDLGIPLTVHETFRGPNGPTFPYVRTPKVDLRDPMKMLVRFADEHALNPVQLAMAGVYDRFPKLRIYWAETQIGWLPFGLSQIDDCFDRSRHWLERLYGLESPVRPLSTYLLTANLWGFLRDPVGVRLRHDIGVDRVLWGSDFAHAAGDWPNSRRIIDEIFVGVPDEERHRMLAGNAVEFFRLNDG